MEWREVCRWSRSSCDWGSDLGAVPDVSHAPLEGSKSLTVPQPSLGGNISAPVMDASGVGKHAKISDSNSIKANQTATCLVSVMELTTSRDWRWEGALWRQCLYLEVPLRLVETGSREGFIALLEYAEEELLCSHVVQVLAKDRQDRHDAVRTFMFFGFSVLVPGHQLIPINSNSLFLACSLE